MKDKASNNKLIIIWVITVALIAITTLFVTLFISYSRSLNNGNDDRKYDKYYVMIADDPKSSLWQAVYNSAVEEGEAHNAYVELLSERLAVNYSKYELLEIAIASDVDGIIVSADESEEMTELINRAMAQNIPVVTVFSDNACSDRISFVGIGNYNLGREYGQLISDISKLVGTKEDGIRVAVLMDSNAKDMGQNVLYAAIGEAIEYDNSTHPYTHIPTELFLFTVDATNSFSVEESVRELLQEKESLPDIVVCLNETDTSSVYQTVVDYNEVGEVIILGYYDSEAILKGIERNVIHSTITVDTKQLGMFSIDALTEYYEMGNTSQYFTADVSIIDKSNVKSYFKEGENNEE